MKKEWIKTKDGMNMRLNTYEDITTERATLIADSGQATMYIRLTIDEMEKLAFHLSATVQHLRRMEDDVMSAKAEETHKKHMES